MQFGIKGGINYSDLSVDNVKNETAITGYHAGVYARINISDHFAMQPEVLYSAKGAKVDLLPYGTTTFKLNYVDVPLLAVYRINKNINIHAGPYFSVLIDAAAKNNSSDSTFNFEKEIDKHNFQTEDYGISAGLGFDILFFNLGVRYNRGLQTISKSNIFKGSAYKFDNAQNAVFQVYAGIHF